MPNLEERKFETEYRPKIQKMSNRAQTSCHTCYCSEVNCFPNNAFAPSQHSLSHYYYIFFCKHPTNLYISLIFSLEGRAWQEPEPSYVTGMGLAHCILGKYLGVVCHCFPPSLDVPTLAARYLRTQRRERS